MSTHNSVPDTLTGTRFATWRILDGLTFSITGPEYVIRALGDRINLSIEKERNQTATADIVWNPACFESLKQHFWTENMGSECLVEYRNSDKHLFLGASHYELLHTNTGTIEFYTHTGHGDMHNRFGYPFLRWIGRILNERGYTPIHAAAIGENENYILIPGKATAGKSTTTATWMIHGNAYLSDDFVFLSGNSAKGYYKGINLRPQALRLFKDAIPGIYQKYHFSPVNDEKIFLHGDSKSRNHQVNGQPSAIWCPEIGYSKPHLRRISASAAYTRLLSSIQLNKEYGFDLRLCHNQIKKLVKELPAYALCLTANVSENFTFMNDAYHRIIRH